MLQNQRLSSGGVSDSKFRKGPEIELFILDRNGNRVSRADELIFGCKEKATDSVSEIDFRPEFVHSMLEIGANPSRDLLTTMRGLVDNLGLAMQTAKGLDLRLCPAGAYPGYFHCDMREKEWYRIQAQTVGEDHFENAANCCGFHFHSELPSDLLSTDKFASFPSQASKEQLVTGYNFLTSIDPALSCLLQSSPFFGTKQLAKSSRVTMYRGSREFGWKGVYEELPLLGGLLPYVENFNHSKSSVDARYAEWGKAMSLNGFPEKLAEQNGGALGIAWNPVKINKLGTLEARGMDMNLPSALLGAAISITTGLEKIWTEQLQIVPVAESAILFQPKKSRILVPDFQNLNDLLYRSVTDGLKDDSVADYCRSLVEFTESIIPVHLAPFFQPIKAIAQSRETLSDRMLKLVSSESQPNGTLSQRDSQKLVLWLCNLLEQDVAHLRERLLTAQSAYSVVKIHE